MFEVGSPRGPERTRMFFRLVLQRTYKHMLFDCHRLHALPPCLEALNILLALFALVFCRAVFKDCFYFVLVSPPLHPGRSGEVLPDPEGNMYIVFIFMSPLRAAEK